MAWDDPEAGLTTGSLVTSDIWNQDVRDNTKFLKGQAGEIDFEAGATFAGNLRSTLDNTHLLGRAGNNDNRYSEVHGVKLFGNRYRADKAQREAVFTWEVLFSSGGDILSAQQVARVVTGSGADISSAGTGQIVLNADADLLGTARFDSIPATNNSLANSWGVGKNPYYRTEFAVSSVTNFTGIFMGFRQTLGSSVPTTENHAGLQQITGSGSWQATQGSGAAQTVSTETVTSGLRHIFEVIIRDDLSTKEVEYWLDGVLLVAITSNIPTGNLEFTCMLISDGTDTSTNITYLTVGELVVQEDLA